MKCPICGNEMTIGRLIILDSRMMSPPEWYPVEEAARKGLGTIRRNGGIPVGYPEDYRALSGENHYEAYHCKCCKKIIGCFDEL